MENEIANLLKLFESFGLKGQAKWIKTKGGIVVAESAWSDNKVLTNANLGMSIILDRLVGINTYSLNITHADIGDNATAALATDPGLYNALERAAIGAVSRSGVTADFRFFYPDALTTNGTYREFSMVIDGSATLGTGKPFNRLVFGTPMVKATGEDHTILARVTGSV